MKKILVTGGGAPAGINFINSLNDAPEDFDIISSDINKFHFHHKIQLFFGNCLYEFSKTSMIVISLILQQLEDSLQIELK